MAHNNLFRRINNRGTGWMLSHNVWDVTGGKEEVIQNTMPVYRETAHSDCI